MTVPPVNIGPLLHMSIVMAHPVCAYCAAKEEMCLPQLLIANHASACSGQGLCASLV